MISVLKNKGYKLTKKDTLNNREFREFGKSFVISDRSTLSDQTYDITEIFELFLDEKFYKESLMMAILDETRDEPIDEITADVERQERGYLITFTTTKIGVT